MGKKEKVVRKSVLNWRGVKPVLGSNEKKILMRSPQRKKDFKKGNGSQVGREASPGEGVSKRE